MENKMINLPNWILEELDNLNFSKEETQKIWKIATPVWVFSDELTHFGTNKQEYTFIALAINISKYLKERYDHLNELNTRQALDEIAKFPELESYNTSEKYAFALLQYCVSLQYLKKQKERAKLKC